MHPRKWAKSAHIRGAVAAFSSICPWVKTSEPLNDYIKMYIKESKPNPLICSTKTFWLNSDRSKHYKHIRFCSQLWIAHWMFIWLKNVTNKDCSLCSLHTKKKSRILWRVSPVRDGWHSETSRNVTAAVAERCTSCLPSLPLAARSCDVWPQWRHAFARCRIRASIPEAEGSARAVSVRVCVRVCVPVEFQ
jgi:hypothetical protein